MQTIKIKLCNFQIVILLIVTFSFCFQLTYIFFIEIISSVYTVENSNKNGNFIMIASLQFVI